MATPMSDEELFEFCGVNPGLRIERTREGEIIVMAPTGGETGRGNAEITSSVVVWAKKDGRGVAFDSSTAFVLPDGAERSPDAAWIRKERWDALTPEQRRKFPPLCPNFVVELRSPSEPLRELQTKMEEYRDNGAALGWLIDPEGRAVHVYRPNRPVERLEGPSAVSGEPEMPGLVLDLVAIWGG